MRGATIAPYYAFDLVTISTHTPHARCDGKGQDALYKYLNFYSHTSCEVRRTNLQNFNQNNTFYSHTSCEVRRKLSP